VGCKFFHVVRFGLIGTTHLVQPPIPNPPIAQQVKEIKNGRLAMVAFLGYFAQAAATQKGPLQNAVDFLQDPLHSNVFGALLR